MTVAENVGYGLRVRGEPRDRIAARVAELLTLIKLPDYAPRYPHQLSGDSNSAWRWRAHWRWTRR